jgi:glutamine synthetase
MSDSKMKHDLQAALEAQGVKYLIPSYVDMHGVSKSKMVPIDHLRELVADPPPTTLQGRI